jgi:lipopolysaccharide/colanic/teichoic acid biosynthesis glycosyltransferase
LSSQRIATGTPIEGEGPEVDWAGWVADLPPTPYRRLRAAADPVVAAGLLVLLLPALALIALAIKLDSPGPALFRQPRAGRLARRFTMVKFRTMRTGSPPSSLKVPEDSPMITRAGRFLRGAGLDELPNLWNVVSGDMALIGPRPEQYDLLGYYQRWQHERHLVKPGITGWWQIHHRGSEPMHLNVEKDIYYVRHQCLLLDLHILARTARLPLLVAAHLRPIRSLGIRLGGGRRSPDGIAGAKPSAGD